MTAEQIKVLKAIIDAPGQTINRASQRAGVKLTDAEEALQWFVHHHLVHAVGQKLYLNDAENGVRLLLQHAIGSLKRNSRRQVYKTASFAPGETTAMQELIQGLDPATAQLEIHPQRRVVGVKPQHGNRTTIDIFQLVWVEYA
jgi:hypothetical protein